MSENHINRIPKIKFINGYDLNEYEIWENFRMNWNDRHIIGDSENWDESRNEYLTFIEIKEIMFLKGSYY